MELLRFVALIGALVFVHELGHFFVARLFGVRVLTFSLGFGPRLFGLRIRGTDYCVSLIPFGGFVKLLGEDPQDPVPAEDATRTFPAQSLWKRALIVFAGPLMSLVFPVFLYFVVFLGQTEITPPVIGHVVPGLPAEGRLFPGDRVLSINEHAVQSFADVRNRIEESPGEPLHFHVLRAGVETDQTITPVSVRIERPLEIVEHVGRAGIAPGFPLPVIAVRDGVNPANRAGLRTFDLVLSYAGRPLRRWIELERSLQSSRGATAPVAYLRPTGVHGALGGLCDLEVFDPGLVQITPDPGEGDVPGRTGIESPELYVADVPARSPEYEMGLRRGDKVLMLDGVAPAGWESFSEAVLAGGQTRRRLTFLHQGREVEGAFSLQTLVWTDEFGQRFSRLSFRTNHWMPVQAEPPEPNPSRFLSAIRRSWREAGEVLRYLSLSLVRIFQGRVSISSVGGPLMIYDVSRSAEGFEGFLWLLGLVSMNLGILNLLPIPTLDGGHLLFFVIEAVTRRPVPLYWRKVASILGLVLLGMLMALALKNDVQRKFLGGL